MQLTPEQIEKMRQIGLKLDRAGVFWQADEQVTHPRLRQALLRWMDVRDGKNIIKLDDKRFAYVDVEDAHLRAKSAWWEGDHVEILWDDDQETELDYASLAVAPDNAFYATVRGLRGRIAGPAHAAISERIEERADGFVLNAAGRAWPIKPASGTL